MSRSRSLLLGAILAAPIVACGQDRTLATAFANHPNSLIAYTLETPTPQSLLLDLDACTPDADGQSDDCPTYFIEPPSGSAPKGLVTSTQFADWLPDHKRAILQGGETDEITKRLYPFDEYIVELASAKSFSPTAVDRPPDGDGKINVGLQPFKNGYLFGIRRDYPPNEARLPDMYTMRFNGTYKERFPWKEFWRPIQSHLCSTAPTGEWGSLAACEIKCGDAINHKFPVDGQHAIKTCIQIYDVGQRRPGASFGPSGFGIVSWRPKTQKDEVGFTYMKGIDKAKLVATSVRVSDGSEIGLGCKSGICPIHDDHFAGRSDFGEWSADGEAFYFARVEKSGVHRIGRVRMDEPDKFEPLTPPDVDAGSPALAPVGASFVCLAKVNKPGLADIQLFRVIVTSRGKCSVDGPRGTDCFRRITHIKNINDISVKPSDRTVEDQRGRITSPRWRSVTNVDIPAIP